ncbi:PepSY-associated TM helix domain-containing protein [Autumnicola edwardsiae]|uniref:PepSY-associated TM helix domain-containing protein n=1 Tax=Autumnicola edwardsiae TaxID=3075594 RepID=A0ABU3CUX7_9FLAO|nr:PepSY-associated TM helix domain-containing protein [Zunongwangia sp. F297]MDT0650116.1 PepSY-associated TM helix domain-containing protein [Zunongwangia sp. F297]
MKSSAKHSEKKKKKNRSYFYRFCAWLHLWLGLISGIVVVVVSLTAAILTFEEEIKLLTEPFQTVEYAESAEFLSPSILSEAVKEELGFPSVYGVYYRGEGRSAMVPYYADRTNYQEIYVNPYTAEILHNRRLNNDFWRSMIIGHYQLWLPRNIGKPIVAYSTLMFVIALITGLVLWWPKRWNKSTRDASFKIKWTAKFKRLNYDLHNVLGFYSLLVALVLGLTGMVYGMQWFSDAVYWTASGGEIRTQNLPGSDTTAVAQYDKRQEDVLFEQVLDSGIDPARNRVGIQYPSGKTGVWNVNINPSFETRWQALSTYYEKGSLKELKKDQKFSEANGGEQLMKLNYDLHVGAIGGIWTKIIAFLVCVISASLPVTGFIVWWKKSAGKRSKALKFPT